MSALPQLLNLLPGVVKPAPAPTRAANVLLVPTPPTAAGSVKHGALAHPDAGPVGGDALPARVVAVLGPGATFLGLADVLLPIIGQATGVPAGTKPLTRDELARAIVAYNKTTLPAGDWQHHQVGLLLPVPIEVDGAGNWTVNIADTRKLASAPAFVAAWARRLGVSPKALSVPEPAQIEGEVRSFHLPFSPPGRPALQWERALRNPSEVVLVFYGIARRRADAGAAAAAGFALAFLATAKPHHVKLLAATTSGNAILRRLRTLIGTAPPAGVDAAKHAAAKALVEGALFQGPAGNRTLVPHKDVPQTVDLLAVAGGNALGIAGAKTDPGGGLQRVVFGRNVAVGRNDPVKVGATTFSGPLFEGRLQLDAVVADDAEALQIDDPVQGGPLALLSMSEPDKHGKRLDAVRARDDKLLTVGVEGWSATEDTGLAALLLAFKGAAADEFDLHFGIHGLDVEPKPGPPTTFRLKQVAANGTTSTPMTPAQVGTFFGRSVVGGIVRLDPVWAARCRLAALVSRRYRRTQIQLAREKVKESADKVKLAVASAGPFPKPYDLAFDSAKSTALQAQVNLLRPGFTVGLPATATSVDHLSGAVIDLRAGPGLIAYASSNGTDDIDTFNIGSMGKAVALYAAFELRHRLRKALAAAKLASMDTVSSGWEGRFFKLVEQMWSSRVNAGFGGPGGLRGLDPTGRFPKLKQMFALTGGAAPKVEFIKGTATDNFIIDLDLGAPNPTTMKFTEMLKSMVFQSNAAAASVVVLAVGYPYLNGLLRNAGFFDPSTNQGIWISADYASHDWAFDYMKLSARGKKHYKATTNLAGNAKQFARLLALADLGKLFDSDGAACSEMRQIMRRHPIAGLHNPDTSPIRDAVVATPPPAGPLTVDEAYAKIGIGVAAPPSTLQGAHDCAIIARKKGATPLRYVAVVVGGYTSGTTHDSAAFRQFARVLDQAVAAVHP
jgi:hypothetical protein